MSRIPFHLTYAHEGRSISLSAHLSPREALGAGVALLAARGLQRLITWVPGGSLDLLGAEKVASVPPPVPQVRLGSGLDLLLVD